MEDSVKGLTEEQVDNIHSPLVYQASHFIVEVYQVGQARIPFGEAMLTTPDDFLVLMISENCLRSGTFKYRFSKASQDNNLKGMMILSHSLMKYAAIFKNFSSLKQCM